MEEEITQPEWMNPKSDLYYKGYRYEQDEDGRGMWFDENNNCRRVLISHETCEIIDENTFILTAILKRIIGLPFFAILSLIAALFLWFKYIRNYIIYGGEAIAFTKKMNRKTIQDVFEKLEESLNKNEI